MISRVRLLIGEAGDYELRHEGVELGSKELGVEGRELGKRWSIMSVGSEDGGGEVGVRQRQGNWKQGISRS